ncbi:MAG: hypothetical protein IJQ25_07895, partial [Oscillibacter sp.]|nr:hypothetical protein [Oscillibacter sp.]
IDNGVVRRLGVDGGRVTAFETLAGVQPEVLNSGKVNIWTAEKGASVPGEEFAVQAHEKASLALDSRGRLLLSDPENSYIYQITED